MFAVALNICLKSYCFFPVPQQENGFDCGLFVCRYLFGLVYLHKEEQNISLSTIEDSHLFKFAQDDISRMRNEFAILLTRLTIYSSKLDEELKEYKRDKEERRRIDAESFTPTINLCDGVDDDDPAGIKLSSENKEISKSLETCEKEERRRIDAESCTPTIKLCDGADDDDPAGIKLSSEKKEISKSLETCEKEEAQLIDAESCTPTVDRATNTDLLAITEKDLQNLKVPALKKLCEEAGITKKSSSYIKKKDLIQAIMDHNK